MSPRTRYPVVGLPSGAGFTTAELHDLVRPHLKVCQGDVYGGTGDREKLVATLLATIFAREDVPTLHWGVG